MKDIILYAANITSGGGKVLLEKVIADKVFGKVITLFIDARCDLSISLNNVKVFIVRPTLLNRFKAEYKAKKVAEKTHAEVMFFGNLPGVFKVPTKSYVFFQNAHLLLSYHAKMSFRVRLRQLYEKFIFYTFVNNTHEVIVQTKWMKNQLESSIDRPIKVLPILPNFPNFNEEKPRNIDLLAITGKEPHKKLTTLMAALEKIDRKINVCIVANTEIEIKNKNIQLTHYKQCCRDEIYNQYKNSRNLIILSTFESFCLPYYEAKHFKLKIISPNSECYGKPDIPLKTITPDTIKNAIEKAY